MNYSFICLFSNSILSIFTIIPAMALKRGRQIKGTAKHKGAKGQSYKKKDKNKIKTKAKTVNKNLNKRPQKIAIAKATKTGIQTDRNRNYTWLIIIKNPSCLIFL